jgi:glucose/arabinose dehydrogenase
MRVLRTLLLSFLVTSAVSAQTGDPQLHLERIVGGLSRPLGIVAAGDGSDRLFIVQQGGLIRILENGVLLSAPFLDLTARVSCCGERGLLGLAFHPDYDVNGFFFVNYTDNNGETVVARYSVSSNPDVASAQSAVTILQVPQPFSNHNGGQLQFGPDGYLYIGMGDGGSGGDPGNRAQSIDTLLGKMLRIDVDHGLPYTIPPDNPLRFRIGARPEIWATGLRNPWRFSFDRQTGDLWIADVGQGTFEEIDFQSASSDGGENYGWRLMEGFHCFTPSTGCTNGVQLTLPVYEYDHSVGCSVTGGYRYRGPRYPRLNGVYLFGDFCSGVIFGGFEDGSTFDFRTLLASNLAISTFGEDERGEVYVADYDGGTVYRIEDAAPVKRRRPVHH